MNQEKIGKFIAKLRKENNMTQDELSEKIPISRQAISKWERGVSIPNSETLLILSNIFNVSVNEILSGEKINDANKEKVEQISLKLYDNINKSKKIIKFLGGLIVLLIITILGYYFINSYKKVKIYTVSGESKSYLLNDGIFVKTNEKIYFNLGGEIFSKYDNVQKISLYYIDPNNTKKLLSSTTQSFIQIVDYKGYNSYFDFEKLNNMISNLTLEVTNENGDIETLQLKFTEDYINDLKTIFSKKDKPLTSNDKNNYDNIIDLKDDYKKIEEKIYEKFEKNGDGYFYTIKQKDLKYNFSYDDFTRLNISTFEENKIIEEFNFILKTNQLIYNNYLSNINFELVGNNFNCLSESCEGYEDKIVELNELINAIL